MGDHQKIHPVNADASPSAPLAPRDSLRSEKIEEGAGHQYPPYRRTIPVSHTRPSKKRRNCCCRCFCWTICLLILLIVLLAATTGILYLIFRPKVPKYSVDRLTISSFQVNPDMSVFVQLDVTVTARNPNKKIGIYYGKGSKLGVWYADTQLANGTLPNFYQGHQNTTVLVVALAGQTQIGSALLTALQEQQQTGRIPLVFRAEVPVRVKFGALKLRKVRFLVRCNMVVDSLSANNPIRIRTSNCRFKLRL